MKEGLAISYQLLRDGFQIKIGEETPYTINFPPYVFNQLNLTAKKILAENFLYSRTALLTLLTDCSLNYLTKKPFLKKLIDQGVVKDLPRLSEVNNLTTTNLLNRFQKSQKNRIIFQQQTVINNHLPFSPTSPQKVILALSFGKDSLLSYGLIKEIGLDCQVIFGNEFERYNYCGSKFQIKAMKMFRRREQQLIYCFSDNVDIENITFNHQKMEELDNTNGMLAFTLTLIPFAYFFQAKYLIFGNEQNLNNYFINRGGFKIYPSYDQSSSYMRNLNQNLQQLTHNQIRVASLVEPLYNLAEMKILYHRYHQLLPYTISCSPDELKKDKWCYHCPMCAKAFLYTTAIGGDPQKMGFKKNFFHRQYQNLYPIFAKKISRCYEKPPQVKEEQLLAFLLAYRQGRHGGLIDLFKQKYLPKALKNEKYLRKKYFGLHKIYNIPQEWQPRLLKIYHEELANLW